MQLSAAHLMGSSSTDSLLIVYYGTCLVFRVIYVSLKALTDDPHALHDHLRPGVRSDLA